MAPTSKFGTISADQDDVNDLGLDYEKDDQLRYLGHDKAVYGFVLVTEKSPSGEAFEFTLNPQSIEQDEEGAVAITPTQGGGKFIENQGNIFKDIIISGTTGFLPPKAVKNPAIPGTAALASAFDQLTDADQQNARVAGASVSGYHEFHRLRRLFRLYWQTHRTGNHDAREKCKLYWVNLKDNEVWLVEPLGFRMPRSSRSPMTYPYTIRLRTIAAGSSKPPQDPTDHKLDSVSATRVSLARIRDRIDAAVNLLGQNEVFLEQFRAIQSNVSSIIATGTTLSTQLNNITSGAKEVLTAPISAIKMAGTNIENVFEAVTNAHLDPPLSLVEGLTSLKQEFNNVVARHSLFISNWGSKWSSAISNFKTEYGIQGDASAYINAPGSRTNVKQGTVNKDDTLQTAAARLTGDSTRAHELAVRNNLKWPYISPSPDERLPNTVAPGDPLLVPTTGSSDLNDNLIPNTTPSATITYKDEAAVGASSTVTKAAVDRWRINRWVGFTVEIVEGTGEGQVRLVASNTADTLTVNVAWDIVPDNTSVFKIYFKRVQQPPKSGIEEVLGVDLRIARNNVTNLYDLVADSSGDVQRIRGTENFNQALNIKFMTSQGDLMLHPWFGLRPVPGSRGTPSAVFRLRTFFEQTLLSDSRTESVKSVQVTMVGDQLRTESKISVKGGLESRYVSPLI